METNYLSKRSYKKIDILSEYLKAQHDACLTYN